MTDPDSDLADLLVRTRKTYDSIAPAYARQAAFMPDNLKDLVARTLDRLTLAPATVLDVGCGAGRDMVYFESRGCRVTGLDLSEQMLVQARLLVRGSLVQGSALDLPFADGSYDVAWACASLLHLPKDDLAKALDEARRVLRPSGVFTISVKEGSGEQDESNPYDPDAPARFVARYELIELQDRLRAAGFVDIETTLTETAQGERWLEMITTRSE